MTLRHISLRASADLDGFRQAARKLVAEGVAPDEVAWTADDTPLPLP
jgi:uracil-DNA glycosylase